MSTRASIILKDGSRISFYYQHSDGYPEGLGQTILGFCASKIAQRNKGDIDCLGAALVLFCNEGVGESYSYHLPELVPTSGVHGDESYQYTVDVNTLKPTISSDVLSYSDET